MKKSSLNKKGKQKISVIQRHVWDECKRITRARYIKKDDTWDCFTCGRLIDEAWKAQTGHFIAKGSLGAYLKYDLRVLRIQCYFCNINCGGAGALFYENLVKTEGQEYVNQIIKDRQVTVQAYDHYLKLLEEYKKL